MAFCSPSIRDSDDHPGVVVLYNHSADLVKGEPRDVLAEQGVIACAHAVASGLRKAGYRTALVPMQTDVELAMAPYPPTQWVVFNLGEGLDGRLFEEARIAWALEAMGYSFTGSDGDAIARSVNKARAKSILAAKRVPTPPWWLFHHPDEVDHISTATSPFPLIVKPVAEDASLGIGSDAVVHTVRQLRDRVAYVVECYRQAALAEAFVAGREFNISLLGHPPRVLPLAEVDFSAFNDPYGCIVSFAAKWETGSFEYDHTPILCPAHVEPTVGARIRATARRAWDAIGCRGYARADIRLSEDGVPYVVEVNCNPDLSPDAGFFRAAHVAGFNYEGIVVNILDIALRQKITYDRDSNRGRWLTDSRTDSNRWHLQTGRGRLRPRAVEQLSATR